MDRRDSISLFQAVIKQWKNIFVFSGNASKKEYWYVLLVDVIVALIAGVLLSISASTGYDNEILYYVCLILGALMGIIFTVSLVPLFSLTIRRLHDTGKSGWWMFLLLIVGIGTVVIMFMCANSSINNKMVEYKPQHNIQQNVYGPPPLEYDDFLDEEIEDETSGDEDDEDIDSEADADESEDVDEDKDNSEGGIIFTPEQNINPVVYGPPSMLEDME